MKPNKQMKLKTMVQGLSILLLFTCCNTKNQTSILVGTYTNGDSQGVYQLNIDLDNGQLLDTQLKIETQSPSFFHIEKKSNRLFLVNELENFEGQKSGAVSTYSYNAEGNLTEIESFVSGGSHPCHINYSNKNNLLTVSNYTGGNFLFAKQGKEHKNKFGTRLVKEHTKKEVLAHAHCTMFSPDEKFVYCVDLGHDRIYKYDTNLRTEVSIVAEFTKGTGPRHMVFSHNGMFAYVICELNSTMAVFSVDKITGALKQIQELSTLSDNFKGESFCADLHLSRDGNYLYGSNRGENSIVVFKVGSNGSLTKIQNCSTEGEWPRNFMITENQKLLLVANQKSNNITLFERNNTTGRLEYLKKSYSIDSPVCLKEWNL